MRISQSRGDGEEEEEEEEKDPGGLEPGTNMLIPKSYSWKATRAQLIPTRQAWHLLRNFKTWVLLAMVAILVLAWRSMGSAAGEMQRYVDYTTALLRIQTTNVLIV